MERREFIPVKFKHVQNRVADRLVLYIVLNVALLYGYIEARRVLRSLCFPTVTLLSWNKSFTPQNLKSSYPVKFQLRTGRPIVAGQLLLKLERFLKIKLWVFREAHVNCS